MWQFIISYLEKIQIPCIFKKKFDIPCPGCGFQTAFIKLLKGNFYDAFLIYPAIYPIILLILALILHITFRFKIGSQILLILFYISLLTIITQYIYFLNR